MSVGSKSRPPGEKNDGARALVVGDLMLDTFYASRQANPALHYNYDGEVVNFDVTSAADRQTWLGGSGRTGLILSMLGTPNTCVGMTGDDLEGNLVVELMEKNGIEPAIVPCDGRLTTQRIRIVSPETTHRSRVRLNVDTHAPPSDTQVERLADLVEKHMGRASILVVDDFGKGCIDPTVISRSTTAKDRYQIPLIIDPHKNWHPYLETAERMFVDLFFCAKEEFGELLRILGETELADDISTHFGRLGTDHALNIAAVRAMRRSHLRFGSLVVNTNSKDRVDDTRTRSYAGRMWVLELNHDDSGGTTRFLSWHHALLVDGFDRVVGYNLATLAGVAGASIRHGTGSIETLVDASMAGHAQARAGSSRVPSREDFQAFSANRFRRPRLTVDAVEHHEVASAKTISRAFETMVAIPSGDDVRQGRK